MSDDGPDLPMAERRRFLKGTVGGELGAVVPNDL
jgi:hypothetical protein